MGEVSACLNEQKLPCLGTQLTPHNLAQMIKMFESGTISSKIAKQLFKILVTEGGDADIVPEHWHGPVVTPTNQAIDQSLGGQPASVEDYRNRDEQLFLVGQIMKVKGSQPTSRQPIVS